MKIISHRGMWSSPVEKNTIESFKRSFEYGFGIETDIRDYNERIVISHDLPNKSSVILDDLFDLYSECKCILPIAINIKSDGLQSELIKSIKKYDIKNYFVFDMSVPDAIGYCRSNIRVYTRQSDYEITPSFYVLANGVWIDEFDRSWISREIIDTHLDNAKEVCIVSPELHNRDYRKTWEFFRQIEREIGKDILSLCTDLPELAMEFFNEEN